MVQLLLSAILLAVNLSSPRVAWHYDTGDIIMCSPAVGDLDPTWPGSEVVIGHMHGRFVCLASDGRFLWDFDAGGWCLHPAIADIDDDGSAEVLLHTMRVTGPANVYCLNSDGSLRWSHCVGHSHYGGLTVANVDTVGHAEILAGGPSSLLCLNSDGSLKWSYSVGDEVCSPAVANIDEQGTPEVIFGSPNGRVYCLDSDGNLKWYISLGCASEAVSVADVDLDGEGEVIAVSSVTSASNVLYCLESNGTLRWTKQLLIGGSAWLSMAAIDDINNDSLPEIVVFSDCYSDHRDSLYAVQDAGDSARVVWVRKAVDTSGGSATAPVICDLDGDGIKEVIWQGTSYLRIYHGLDGATIYESNDFTSYTAREHPAVADIDGDGHADIVGIYRGTEVGVLTSDDWVACRDQFSSYTYHITNINNDLSVPKIAPNHWESHNSWLSQERPEELASICGGKFYDSNVNGLWDAGEVGLEGWLIILEGGVKAPDYSPTGAVSEVSDKPRSRFSGRAHSCPVRQAVGFLSVDSVYTDTGGYYGFVDLEPGSYRVREVIPDAPPVWVATTPTEYSVTVQAGQNVTGVDFGNVVLGEVGARTIGYWKNHVERITARMYAVLDILPAFRGCGNPDSVLAILTPPWPDMVAKLRAQLLAMTLNVLSGVVSGDGIVYLGWDVQAAELLFGLPAPSFKAAQEVLDAVELAYDWGGWTGSEQEAVKDLLDRMNNDLLFVLPGLPGSDRLLPSFPGGSCSVGEYEAYPSAFHLFQNVPNPFGAGGTTIQFKVESAKCKVSLRIYDVTGRLVKTLVDGWRAPGVHSVHWVGQSDDGRATPGGVYFCEMVAGSWVQAKNMAKMQ